MQDSEKQIPVSGGTMTIYRVADIIPDEGEYSFFLTDDFAESHVSLVEPDSEKAQILADYAKKNELPGQIRTIGNDGQVQYSHLEIGLFLVVQEEAANGYHTVAPFLVSIPLEEDGHYIYDVDATPKMEILKENPQKPSIQLTGDNSQIEKWEIILSVSSLLFCVIMILNWKEKEA